MSPCLTLNIMRYGSRVKWSYPGNEVALSPFGVVAIEKRAPRSPSTMVTNFTQISGDVNDFPSLRQGIVIEDY